MAQYQIPGGPFVVDIGTSQVQIPGGQFWNGRASSSKTPRRALYWNDGQLCEITDALIGVGKSPIVLAIDGFIKTGIDQGAPIILDNGTLRTINSQTESLVI